MRQTVDTGQLAEDSKTAARAVRNEAIAVRDAAIEHPHTATVLLGIVAASGFLLGHLIGYRSAERDLTPPERSRRFW